MARQLKGSKNKIHAQEELKRSVEVLGGNVN